LKAEAMKTMGPGALIISDHRQT